MPSFFAHTRTEPRACTHKTHACTHRQSLASSSLSRSLAARVPSRWAPSTLQVFPPVTPRPSIIPDAHPRAPASIDGDPRITHPRASFPSRRRLLPTIARAPPTPSRRRHRRRRRLGSTAPPTRDTARERRRRASIVFTPRAIARTYFLCAPYPRRARASSLAPSSSSRSSSSSSSWRRRVTRSRRAGGGAPSVLWTYGRAVGTYSAYLYAI